MIKITVKTIDSNNYEFAVEESITVRAFKELIASTVNIEPNQQRLIFCGRVLSDDRRLTDYEINDGKVVHLVMRAPPMRAGTESRANSVPNSAQSSPRHNPRSASRGGARDDNSYLVGAFSIPHEAFNVNNFQQMLQNVVSNMGDIGRNATVMSHTSEDGSSVDVQINLAQMPPQNEARQRVNYANRFLGYINAIIDVIERPDSIPRATVNEAEMTIGGQLFGDPRGDHSLEEQLVAQSLAAATNAFQQMGVPLTNLIHESPPNLTQSQSNPIRISQPNISVFQDSNRRADRNASETDPNANISDNTDANRDNSNQRQPSRNGFESNSRPVMASELTNLFNAVFRTEERLRPHLQRFQQLISGVATEQQMVESQNLQRNVMRAVHHLSHVFHLISDLSINFNNNPRTVNVLQSVGHYTSMENVSVSMPFMQRQSNNDTSSARNTRVPTSNGTPSTTNNSGQNANSDGTAFAGTTTTSTYSVPRFAQSNSMGQSNSVFVAQSPIVVMEVGSTVERIPIQIPINGHRNESNTQQTNTANANPNPRPLFIPPPFDPFLQCNSPFTIPEIRTRVSVGISGRNSREPFRPQQNNANTNNNSQNNNNNNNSNNNNQSGNNMFASLGQIVNSILSGFLGQANASQPPSEPRANSHDTAEPSVNVDPTLIELMGRLNSQRRSSDPQSQSPQSGQPEEAANMTDMFMSFVNGILNIISGGQTNSINVAEFLNRLDGFNYVEGENIANDIFMTMARVLTFQDLFYIFAGNSQPLNQTREPLRQFVRNTILNGLEPNRDNVNNSIEQLITAWRPGLEAMTTGLQAVSEIDLLETIRNFLRINLDRLFTFLLFPPADDYGTLFFTNLREVFIDMISLSHVCFVDGVESLQRMVSSFIGHISSELNPAIQEWMQAIAIRHLNDYINNNNSAETDNNQTYIIRTSGETDIAETASTVNGDLNRAETESSNSSTARMELNNELPEVENVEFCDALSDIEEPTSANAYSIETPYNQLPTVVVGTESWHSSVPRDWVPIITHDLSRQRRLPIQRGFSDAYMTGMPKKRRIERPSIKLRDSLQNALSSSGARPITATSEEEIVGDLLSTNVSLNYFDDLIRSSVNERIRNDEDYANASQSNPERFTNTKNYFIPK